MVYSTGLSLQRIRNLRKVILNSLKIISPFKQLPDGSETAPVQRAGSLFL
jgi:hypothetical protein